MQTIDYKKYVTQNLKKNERNTKQNASSKLKIESIVSHQQRFSLRWKTALERKRRSISVVSHAKEPMHVQRIGHR